MALHFVMTLVGCGVDRVPVYPVSGKVLHQGQPAAGAEVVFHATDAAAAAAGHPIPRGTVTSDGSFELTSYEHGDGAPAGTYDVTVVWAPDPADPNADPESAGPMADRLRSRYAHPDRSGLSATVNETQTQLEPFELE